MAVSATVQSIGDQAISEHEPILIFFDETATAAIQNIAVIQKFDGKSEPVTITVGNSIKIDDQAYTVAYAGELVNANLNSIGHATLYFTAVPEKPMQNGIYLAPATMPQLKVGSVITYQA